MTTEELKAWADLVRDGEGERYWDASVPPEIAAAVLAVIAERDDLKADVLKIAEVAARGYRDRAEAAEARLAEAEATFNYEAKRVIQSECDALNRAEAAEAQLAAIHRVYRLMPDEPVDRTLAEFVAGSREVLAAQRDAAEAKLAEAERERDRCSACQEEPVWASGDLCARCADASRQNNRSLQARVDTLAFRLGTIAGIAHRTLRIVTKP